MSTNARIPLYTVQVVEVSGILGIPPCPPPPPLMPSVAMNEFDGCASLFLEVAQDSSISSEQEGTHFVQEKAHATQELA